MSWLDGVWTIEADREYTRGQGHIRKPPGEDIDAALEAYTQGEMRGWHRHTTGAGSGSNEHGSFDTDFIMGVRRDGDYRHFRALCAVAGDGQPVDTYADHAKADCEDHFLRTIKRASQPRGDEPYVTGGASQVEWSSKMDTIMTGGQALIIDGRFSAKQPYAPCLSLSDCCSMDGSIYLDSCRAPTEDELRVIDACLRNGHRTYENEYQACLRDADVKIGCEEQPDGSRLCY